MTNFNPVIGFTNRHGSFEPCLKPISSEVSHLDKVKVQCQVTPSQQTSNVKLEIHAGATRPFRKLCNLTTMDKSRFKLGLSYAKKIIIQAH